MNSHHDTHDGPIISREVTGFSATYRYNGKVKRKCGIDSNNKMLKGCSTACYADKNEILTIFKRNCSRVTLPYMLERIPLRVTKHQCRFPYNAKTQPMAGFR